MLKYKWLVLAAALLSGCENVMDGTGGTPGLPSEPAAPAGGTNIVPVWDGAELNAAVSNGAVETIEVKAETHLDASAVDLYVRTAKTIIIQAGVTVTVRSVHAAANAVIVGKEAAGEGQIQGAAKNESGPDVAGILRIAGGLYVEREIDFDIKNGAVLVFDSTVTPVIVDGLLRCEQTGAIYALGSGVSLNGEGYIEAGGARARAVEFDLEIAADGGGDTGGKDEGGNNGQPASNLTEDIRFYNADYSSGTGFDMSEWEGDGTANESWTLTALEQNWVYFAVTKTAGQSITVGGEDGGKVRMDTSGSVAGALAGGDGGLEAGGTRAVFTVDTRDLVFEGGTRTFTLAVSESGKAPKTVTVNARVEAAVSGAAVFLVTHDADGGETLARQDTGTEVYEAAQKKPLERPAPFTGMYDALAWVDWNTGTEREWLIRVEKPDTQIPQMLLDCQTDKVNYASNVKIRLRGMGDTEHLIRHNDAGGSGHGNVYKGRGGNAIESKGLISVMGKSRDDATPGITLQLEKGITLKGNTIIQGPPYTRMLDVADKSLLVMKAGSKITGHDAGMYDLGKSVSVIQLDATNNWDYQYRVVIEAGAEISGNTLPNGNNATGIGEDRITGNFPMVLYIKRSATNPITTPIVFISKDAVIENNGYQGDPMVIANLLPFYIHWTLSREADNYLPPGETPAL
jgi:hypothetical protein